MNTKNLPVPLALIFGHLCALFFGAMAWCQRSPNAPYFLFSQGDTGDKRIKHLFTYGLGSTVGLLLIVYGLSWWLSKKEKITSFTTALSSFCWVLWPGLFGLLIIPATFLELHDYFFRYLMAPSAGLILAFLTMRFLEWKGADDAPAPSLTEEQAKTKRTLAFQKWGGISLAAIGLYFIWFTYFSIARHVALVSGLNDLGIYDQLMWNTLQGRPFECAMFRLEWVGYNVHEFNNHFFSEHFIPTFWLLTPLYWLLPSAWTILAAQTFMIAASGIPAFLIAWKKLGNAPFAFLLVLALLNHPLVQQANMGDMHIDTWAMVFVLSALASLLYKRLILYWVFLVLALGCKQEISVTVALIGVFLFFAEKEHRKLAIGTFGLGIFWYLLTVQIVIPHFRNGTPLRQFERYGHFVPEYFWGSGVTVTPGLVLRRMIENPGRSVAIILDPDRLLSIIKLVAPFGFLMLFQRWAWLWLLPVAALHLMSGASIQYTLDFYYGITLVPAAFVGSVYGARYLLRVGQDSEAQAPDYRVKALSAGLVLTIVFVWNGFSKMPFGGQFKHERYEMNDRTRLIYEYMEEIPDDAVVTANSRFGAHLAQRRYVYNFPEVVNEGEGITEYIFVDTRGIWWPLNRDEEYYIEQYNQYIESEEWGLVLPYDDGLLLFKRGYPKDENPVTFEELDFTEFKP